MPKARQPNEAVVKAISEVIRDNPTAGATYKSLLARGWSESRAQNEIAKVVIGCFWETGRGMPNRFESVLQSIQDGKTAEQLFPDALYVAEGDPPQ